MTFWDFAFLTVIVLACVFFVCVFRRQARLGQSCRDYEADVKWAADKIDGLEADLEYAVEVAFNRGATEWTRLNYPKQYASLTGGGCDLVHSNTEHPTRQG